jgi:glutathione synthase/RimK-type ligase-like ATP-grasp enzyme
MKIAFVTNPKHPEIEEDDRPLGAALARRGALVVTASWDDPDFAWERVDLAVLRSPWDYCRRYEEFLGWLARAEARTRIVNDPEVVRWNVNKRYLEELAAKGVSTVPTAFVARGEVTNLRELCSSRGWETVVLKPSISADSWETIRVSPDQYAEGQAYLDRHRPDRDIMVQPFVKDVEEGGEHSLMFFGGVYSHAVRKNSLFKGGRHVGPEGRPSDPGSDALKMAESVLAKAGVPQIPYARVDIARDDRGAPLLLELELFEPTLFFLEKPGSEEFLARILMP